jgi:hypothetical protein
VIICHKYKFIFLKTEKTAGTSLEIALSGFCGPGDIITPISPKDEELRQSLGFRGPQNFNIHLKAYSKGDIARLIFYRNRLRFYNHITAREVLRFVPKSVWDSYFKFCFERNPFDRIISLYHWEGRKEKSILEFIKSGRATSIRGMDIYSINSIPVVDKIYKYEEMDAALQDISNRLNLSELLKLPEVRAKGNVRMDERHYREVLSPEEVDLIRKVYAREIAWMGYEF